MTSEQNCVFCKIVRGEEPAEIVWEWPETIAFLPLKGVTLGHTLIVPKAHVKDFAADPLVSGVTMARASELTFGQGDANIITSMGVAATQSVFHLHLHLIPRTENDGLALPWYSGKHRKRKEETT